MSRTWQGKEGSRVFQKKLQRERPRGEKGMFPESHIYYSGSVGEVNVMSHKPH